MATDWKSPYCAALREHDPARIQDLSEQARHAINTRLLELAKLRVATELRAAATETTELAEALRELLTHEVATKRKPPKSARSK